MSGVIAEVSARQDVLIRRGVTTRWGVLWEISSDGKQFEPVDLNGLSGVVELRSSSGELWLSIPVSGSGSGVTAVDVTPALLNGPEWRTRSSGEWTMNMTLTDGRVERLGDGYFYLEA